MVKKDQPAISIARNVISGHLTNERDIEGEIRKLVFALGFRNDVNVPVRGEGFADIVVPQFRVLIEVKARGHGDDPYAVKGKESPYAQAQRYTRALHKAEQERLGGSAEFARPWIGIVTDGDTWNAWPFDSDADRFGDQIGNVLEMPTPEELLDWLGHVFGDAPFRKLPVPANPSRRFKRLRNELGKIYRELSGSRYTHTKTKFELWADILEASSMRPDNPAAAQRLFVAHSFLVALAKGVIHALNHPDTTPDSQELFSEDFIAWIVSDKGAGHQGRQWADALLKKIHSYDWRKRKGDVLRPLYETFVDAKDRADFGEFYTPDWLAEGIVAEVLDEDWCAVAVEETLGALADGSELKGRGVLDPTCGSGTFLYHAALRILNSDAIIRRHLSDVQKADVVVKLVNGIDVHPVAVAMARASILRALPTEPTNGPAAIQVYEGDALIAGSEHKGSLFYEHGDRYVVKSPGGRTIVLPGAFVTSPQAGQAFGSIVRAAEQGHALPREAALLVPANDVKLLEEALKRLSQIIEREGDSVWTWYVSNVTGPLRLARRKVDRIVANPPWVSMANIQPSSRKKGNRKDVLEQLFQRDDTYIWSGGKNAPHNDIAALFIIHCRQLYMQSTESDPAAWLVQSSAIKSENWSKFRELHEDRLAQSIDFQAVKPFGDSRTGVVLFEHRKARVFGTGKQKRLETHLVAAKKKPRTNMSLAEAIPLIRVMPTPVGFPRLPSGYCDAKGNMPVRQGATLVPDVLVVAGSWDIGDDGIASVTTTQSIQGVWRSVTVQPGRFPAHWIQDFLKSKYMLPFGVLPGMPKAILPLNTDCQLHGDPSAVNESWAKLDAIYQQYRGQGSSTPKTLRRQIDFHGKLSALLLRRRASTGKVMVLHPLSGSLMRACRIVPTSAVVGHKQYYLMASSEDEAAYLVGIFNAPTMRKVFVERKTSKIDFNVRIIWTTIPIPRYDAHSALHRAIADIAQRAETLVERWLADNYTPALKQIKASNRIRSMLDAHGLTNQLNAAVQKLLPNHTT